MEKMFSSNSLFFVRFSWVPCGSGFGVCFFFQVNTTFRHLWLDGSSYAASLEFQEGKLKFKEIVRI